MTRTEGDGASGPAQVQRTSHERGQRPRIPRGGHSLLEVFLGLMLLSTVFFALASVFPGSLASLRKSSTMIVADNLARRYIETWREKDFSALQPASNPAASLVDTVDGIEYDTVVTVFALQSDCKQINVQVVWSTGETDYHTCVYAVENPW